MTIAGKSRVFDLKSNALAAGLAVNGGAVNFDVSDNAISAVGEVKVNNVPVSLAWQRFFDAPPEKQPTLRLAAILNEKGREELGMNINHIVKGDLPSPSPSPCRETARRSSSWRRILQTRIFSYSHRMAKAAWAESLREF